MCLRRASTSLHIGNAIRADVKQLFSGLYARAFCHATEDLEKVKRALLNTIGDAEIHITQTEGHHGNPITIVESSVDSIEEISRFFEKLATDDLRIILDTLSTRVDEGCNLFLKIDKQAAYEERIRLGRNEDVISIRVKVIAFPAKREVAQVRARTFIESIALKKES
jgi:RNA binding exosome subunit